MDDSAADAPAPGAATADEAYAQRLDRLQNKWWKKALDVQAPYRANVRRWKLGRTLDVGCGNGRMLAGLPAGSVGVDHNPHLVRAARDRGCTAYTVDEFFAEGGPAVPGSFDAILASHLVEHLTPSEGREVLRSYLPMVRPGGLLLLITPQERGFRFDPTHITWSDHAVLAGITGDLGLETVRQYSFPFPRPVGKLFVYNEFNHVARLPR